MTEPRVYGHTRSGRPITDADVESLAAEAEAGYDVDELIARRAKRGRPSLGSAPARVESVRLDPELRDDLVERAQAEGTTTSEVIREALRRFLRAGRGQRGYDRRSDERIAKYSAGLVLGDLRFRAHGRREHELLHEFCWPCVCELPYVPGALRPRGVFGIASRA